MRRARALVVRSGGRTFDPTSRLEIVERESHTIEPVEPPPEAFGHGAAWVVFTSRAAVEGVTGRERIRHIFRKAAEGARLAAVGKITAEAMRAAGLAPDLVARGSASSLLELLPASLEGARILFPCGDDASAELPEGLRRRGASVAHAVVYRKVPRPRDADLDREILEEGFAAFCPTSPAAARWLFEGAAEAATSRLRETPAVALGETTRRALERLGVHWIVVAPQATFESALRMLEALTSRAAGQ